MVIVTAGEDEVLISVTIDVHHRNRNFVPDHRNLWQIHLLRRRKRSTAARTDTSQQVNGVSGAVQQIGFSVTVPVCGSHAAARFEFGDQDLRFHHRLASVLATLTEVPASISVAQHQVDAAVAVEVTCKNVESRALENSKIPRLVGRRTDTDGTSVGERDENPLRIISSFLTCADVPVEPGLSPEITDKDVRLAVAVEVDYRPPRLVVAAPSPMVYDFTGRKELYGWLESPR